MRVHEDNKNTRSSVRQFDPELGPNCYRFMDARAIDYVPGLSMTIGFPVMEIYLNPASTMQGGLITAAFDNVFGRLCYFNQPDEATTTLDINTYYHRPILEGDELIITATIKSQGKTKIHMVAEAYNQEKKLIATAATNYIKLNHTANGD